MIVTYHGASCFKLQAGDKVLAFDPPSKKSDFKSPRFKADVVFISTDHKDHNGFENISGKEEDREPLHGGQAFLINGPGEYEIGGMAVYGVGSSTSNTIFSLNFDGINICYLGAFEGKEMNSETREALGEVDILFMPTQKGLEKIINKLSPKIVIPMGYDKKQLTDFLKEMGSETKPVEKLTIKKKDLVDKKGEVVVLKF